MKFKSPIRERVSSKVSRPLLSCPQVVIKSRGMHQGGPVMHPTAFDNYLRAGQQWATHLGRNSLSNRTFEFHATYKSLSGKKYQTTIIIEDGIIRSFDF